MTGIIWYELKMRWRSRLYWFILLIANALSLFIPTPLNYPSPEDVPRFYSDWWRAGQAFSGLNILMTLLAAFLVADRVLRDIDLRTKELIEVRPVAEIEYVLGKYLASLVALGVIAIPTLIGTPFIKQAMLGTTMDPWPLVAASLVMYFPPMAFVAALALAVTTLIRSARIFYVLFAILWYFDSMRFHLIYSPVRGIFSFSGVSPFQAFFSSTALGLGTGTPRTSTSTAVVNVIALLIASALLLAALVYLERLRKGRISK